MFRKLGNRLNWIEVTKVSVYLVVLILASSAGIVAAADIKIGGTPDACKGFFEVFKELIFEETGINLIITPSSSAQSLIDLDRGNIDIATTDFTLAALFDDLENKGYPVVQENFQSQGIATNSILVYLNKANRINELTQSQLSEIFTGEITNWEQVGGNKEKIVVIWGDKMPEKNSVFQQYVIGSKPITKTATWATDQKDVVERVVKTPGAIGIGSAAYQSARTHNPKTPYVSSEVIAITKGAPNREIQKLLEIVKTFDN